MPAHTRQPAVQTPASPVARPPTAKYTNKDGTKTITVPKSSASTPPAQPSPTTTSSSKGGPPVAHAAESAPGNGAPAPPVNKKKQKRRAKLAAKAAAAAEAADADADADADSGVANGPNGLPSPASTSSAPLPLPHASLTGSPQKNPRANQHHAPPSDHRSSGDARNTEYWDDETESEDGHMLHPYESRTSSHLHTNGRHGPKPKKTKKKKKKGASSINALTNELQQHASGISKEKIWNTSSQEERERIKQFWLGLGEDERKSLVKIEKDAVLKKMKEQQKHTCSCTVCGRKRTAIELELEGLYDAYYEELELFANQPHHHPDGPPMLGNPRRLGHMPGLHPPRGFPSGYPNHHPSRGRIVEHVDNDEDEDDEEDEVDEYSDEDDLDEDEDDEPEPEDLPQDSAPDAQDGLSFFNFGQSLTVQGMKPLISSNAYLKYMRITFLGGILTVADDLLKNDGRKFIEMMEQLAERRMQRLEHPPNHVADGYSHSVNGDPLPNSHNHAPPEDEEYDEEEEEEEEDYESQEEDFDEEEVKPPISRPLPRVGPVGKRTRLTETMCRRPWTRNNEWRKAVGCSKSSPPACSSRGS